LRWNDGHYRLKPNDYGYAPARLIGDEKSALDKLRAFVKAFVPLKSVGADGKEVSVTRFIDTHGLMMAKNPSGLLGSFYLRYFAHSFDCVSLSLFWLTFTVVCLQETWPISEI